MIPKRPFLLRAMHEWIAENNMTPHIVVNTEAEEVTVPKQHIQDGKIVLNVSLMAVQDFIMDNEALSFSARFGGVAFYIYCPMHSIEAIYARESPADGISFSPDEYADYVEPAKDDEADTKSAAVTLLSAVDNTASDDEDEAVAAIETSAQTDDSVEEASPDQAVESDDEAPPPRKRPSLRVVK